MAKKLLSCFSHVVSGLNERLNSMDLTRHIRICTHVKCQMSIFKTLTGGLLSLGVVGNDKEGFQESTRKENNVYCENPKTPKIPGVFLVPLSGNVLCLINATNTMVIHWWVIPTNSLYFTFYLFLQQTLFYLRKNNKQNLSIIFLIFYLNFFY